MPYDKDRDEFFWDPYREKTGSTFSRDGSDYDPTFKTPKISDAYRVLARHFSPDTLMRMIVVGALYKGSSKISGASIIVDLGSIGFSSEGKVELTGLAKGLKKGVSLEKKIQELFGWNLPPERITGLYFRPMD